MGREEILAILKDYKDQYAQKYGIQGIGVFGSIARNTAKADSDVDVVVRVSKPDLFMLVGIKNDLEEMLHRSVDIVTYGDAMNSFLKNRIDRDAVYV